MSIDLGTARTGYAYAFTNTRDRVIEAKEPGGNGDNLKALSNVLFEEDGTFVAFGFKARRMYASEPCDLPPLRLPAPCVHAPTSVNVTLTLADWTLCRVFVSSRCTSALSLRS